MNLLASTPVVSTGLVLVAVLLTTPPRTATRLTTPTEATLRAVWRGVPRYAAAGAVVLAGIWLLTSSEGGAAVPLMIAAALVAGCITHIIRTIRHRRTIATQRRESATMLAVIIGELQAGATMVHALAAATQAVTLPDLHHQLMIAYRQAAAGGWAGAELEQSSVPAIADMGRGWRVAETTGMSLVGVLTNMHRRIEHQIRHESRTRAALQGANVTALILAILPVVGILMGYAIGADTLAFFTSSAAGGIIVVAGTALECAGMLWSQRIISGGYHHDDH